MGHRVGILIALGIGITLLQTPAAAAVPFQFPTANHALLQPDGDAAFFVGTPGRTWTAGSYGCVRSSGFQFHEGADIRSVQRDKRNEPTDPVRATADGWIVYVSRKAGLSNYGRYAVVGHRVEGLEIYSLYAHLETILPQWEPGKWIAAGEQIGVMGRTSNTRQRISKDRAHLHFELTLLLNEGYPAYFRQLYPKGKNDHGMWNGLNLVGMDPAAILRAQTEQGAAFSLRDYLRERPALFRVRVKKTRFPWLNRYRPLILRGDISDPAQIAGYEIAFDYSGLPYQLQPLTQTALEAAPLMEPLGVDEALLSEHRCRKMIVKTGAKWRLTAKGRQHIELLTFAPR